jgi:hypothetical protein
MDLYVNEIHLCKDGDDLKSYLKYQQLNIKHTSGVVSLIRSSICELGLVNSELRYN